jgi:hypothetical protein
LGSIPISTRAPEQRQKDLQDIQHWIRHKGENDFMNDPGDCFRRFDAALPKKHGEKAKDRARQIEKFLDWTRLSVIESDESDDDAIPPFEKVDSIRAKYRSPEERIEDIEKITNWLRRKGKKDKKYDPTGEFRKLDMLLPKKKKGVIGRQGTCH